MKSRVRRTYKTHYRLGSWRAYERALVSRGDVTLWLSPDASAGWGVPPSGRPGGQQRFSDLAIETALTLRLVFRLPLRQTEGFVRSILTMMRAGLVAPDHTTLSRRNSVARRPGAQPPSEGTAASDRRQHRAVSGRRRGVAGAKHGGRGVRGWKKLHLGVDRAGVIVARALTDATVDDATVGIALIGAAAGDIASVTADAAYDSVAFYEAASARHAQVVVPPTRTARVSRPGPRSRARARPRDHRPGGPWTTPVEEGLRLPSAGARRKCLLPLQIHHWRWPSCSE